MVRRRGRDVKLGKVPMFESELILFQRKARPRQDGLTFPGDENPSLGNRLLVLRFWLIDAVTHS